jgi:DNA-binding HxlR family transcriptional regulator
MLRVTVASYAESGDCPIRSVLDKLGDKWTYLILAVLEDEPVRFNQIRKLIGDISQRVLTEKLRDLERDGYVARTVFPERPPRVEYSLTPLGRSALEPIIHLMKWAIESHTTVKSSRERFDQEQGKARS